MPHVPPQRALLEVANGNAVEPKMLKRRIVCVIQYFDEEREIPWDFVRRTLDGRFDAVVTHLVRYLHPRNKGEEALEHSLGIFASRDEAIKAIHRYCDEVRAADSRGFDPPTWG